MHNIPFGKPMIGQEEKEAVMKLMDNPILVHGPVDSKFEEQFARFTNAPHAISVSSCTAGMHLIYFALGYGTGDEVIVPAPFWVSYEEIVKMAEGIPVFIETQIEDDFKITPKQLTSAITSKTKMMIYSSPCNPSGSVYLKNELSKKVLKLVCMLAICQSNMVEVA